MLKSANCTKKSANCSRKQKKAVFYTIIIQENRIDIFNNRNRWVSYMQGRTVTEQYEKTWGRQPAVGKKIGNTEKFSVAGFYIYENACLSFTACHGTAMHSAETV